MRGKISDYINRRETFGKYLNTKERFKDIYVYRICHLSTAAELSKERAKENTRYK
jgi:hypothetical protein